MKIIYLDREEELVALKKKHPLLVLDFYSEDCPPCEQLAPIYERAAESYPDVLFAKVFRQQNRELALSLGVSGSPTVLFFKDGQLQDTHLSGEIKESDFLSMLQSLSGQDDISTKKETNEKDIKEYDLSIIGSGPAGLSASLYAARYKMNFILIGDLPGGTMSSSHQIYNFPSEVEISGTDLTKKMINQVESLSVNQKKFIRVDSINPLDEFYNLTLSNGEVIKTKNILLATGTKHQHLKLVEAKDLEGRGLSYCALCDGDFYSDKVVAVIGNNDDANATALHLSKIASMVYLINPDSHLTGDMILIDQIINNNKITIIYDTDIVGIIGEKQVTGLKLSKSYNGQLELSVDGIFSEIGYEPDLTLIKQLSIETDDLGYITTKPDQKTSLSGVWAAGSITTNSDSFHQVLTACSEGAVAVHSIYKNLNK